MFDRNGQKVGNILLSILIILGVSLSLGIDALSQKTRELNDSIRYEVVDRSHYRIHTIFIPQQSNYAVVPAVSGGLQSLGEFVSQSEDNIVAAINGGYFDPVNHKTTSFIVEGERIVADPRFNSRLMDNLDLQQYLKKILNRSELRSYNCGEEIRYDIQPHLSPILSNCTLIGSLGGGPGLLPQNTSVAEAFVDYEDDTKIRDAIGSESRNARSAVGITAAGDIILAMAAQLETNPLDSGASLSELSEHLRDLGAVKAMNLDGGSSASLYYDRSIIYGRVDKEGKKIQRPIKSVLLVKDKSLVR